jgi:hypothetical protein
MMNCRDVRDLADAFLSGQLLVETTHDLVRHLEQCPDCRVEIATRRALRDTLRAALERAEDLRPRAEFTAELVAVLRPPRAAPSRRSILRSWWTVAAGLALGAGGGFLARSPHGRSRVADLAREAAGDHQNCAVTFNLAERPIRLDEAGRRYGALYTALATFEFPTLDGFLTILDRHACVYQGRRFGHVVFRHQGVLASLLVTSGAPPTAPELEPDDGGPGVAALPAGRFLGFVVAALDREEVLRLAQALTGPLSRHLS